MMTAVTERVPLHSIENIRVTIVNGRFAPELSDSRLSVLGLVIKSITEAKETHASIFPKSCLKSDTNGLFIYLPAHSHLSQLIHVLHLMNKTAKHVFPQTLFMYLEEASSCTVLEEFQTDAVDSGDFEQTVQCHLDKRESVHYYKIYQDK